MAKKVKMVLYGEPGVGKSVFASKAPKPFFICTDGNYEWLVDFGAKEEDHVQVNSWEEAKVVFKQDFAQYETIVVDLVEDLFKWCEQEFCKRNKVDHVSDVGYGKGYDITRNEFFLEISKLLAKDKHVILISHGVTNVIKDRRGVEHTVYSPSSRIPDKVWDMIEGRVRYFLRCYLQAEESEEVEKDSAKLIKKRYLSLIPKENEFGISRGLDESTTPHDILLDFDEFSKAIGLDMTAFTEKITTSTIKVAKTTSVEDIMSDIKEDTEEDTLVEEPKKRHRRTKAEIEAAKTDDTQITVDEAINDASKSVEEEQLVVVESKPSVEGLSRAEKLAAIKAKLAAAGQK